MPDIDSKFRFVLLAAERAEQILRGSPPRLPVNGRKPCRLAIDEVHEGLVEWGYGSADSELAAPPDSVAEVEARSKT